MARRIAVLLSFTALVTACSAPSEEECRAACTNVVKLGAQHIEQLTEAESEKLLAEAGQQLDPCIQTCVKGNRSYVKCITAATSMKQVDECNDR